jgi:hypothetical protein
VRPIFYVLELLVATVVAVGSLEADVLATYTSSAAMTASTGGS